MGVRKRVNIASRFTVIGLMVMMPFSGYAQEATINGRVTDSTGGVLPGVSLVVVHESSGNTFEAVTDATGTYRIPLRVGPHQISAQLAGFATVTRRVTLLLGQEAVVDLEMVPSAIAETVTVTGEAPLINVASSELGDNIDPQQLSELPVLGRNWMNLTLMAAGARGNAPSETPTPDSTTGLYQFNIDGQQVTQTIVGSFGQPRFNRDAIAEFQFISNRFDATQGRSLGVQVNAITKSGTNTFASSLGAYFRHHRFNAADHVAGRVVPQEIQQVSGSLGGPILRDKLHFFANYEYEREPRTFIYNTAFPSFNFDMSDVRTTHKGGVKLDLQLSPQTRFTARQSTYRLVEPFQASRMGGASRTPSSAQGVDHLSDQVFGTLTRVIGNSGVNELKVGYNRFAWALYSQISNPALARGDKNGAGVGAPTIVLRGLTIGQTHQATPQDFNQANYSVRNDLSYSRGRHNLKFGGEYIYQVVDQFICRLCIPGVLEANLGPVPANIEDLFPDMFDVSTWNLDPLSPISRRFRMGVGRFDFETPRNIYAAWFQDDWSVAPSLTLNLGVRYDVFTNTYSNDSEIDPRWYPAGRPDDTNNVAPRIGFAYSITDRTVLRGGWGMFFGDETNPHAAKAFTMAAVPEVLNDGRPDFASNPFNGPPPTFEDVLASRARREITTDINEPNAVLPFSYQSSIGLQRQVGDTIALEADYVYTGGRKHEAGHNMNLSYNPATGANYPFTDISRRPFPDWGEIGMGFNSGWSNHHALQTGFTKRMSGGWQASGTYTLAGYWDARGLPLSGLDEIPFPLAPDFGGEYTLAATDQRHRAVLNAIWDVGYGFQLSGVYFYGSGERLSTSFGGDLRDSATTEGRLRPDGTISPRNALVGDPIHRIDMRIQRRFQFGGRATIDGILEVFNALNRANFGRYTTQESNRNYGKPSVSDNIAFQPRMWQLGIRATF